MRTATDVPAITGIEAYLADSGKEMMPDHRKTDWRLWTMAGLALLPVLYVVSIGPVFRWFMFGDFELYLGAWATDAARIYLWPYEFVRNAVPSALTESIDAYMDLWIEDGP